MPILFAPLIRRTETITYIDEILVQAENKLQTAERRIHQTLLNFKLKAAPDTTCFIHIAVKFLGHINNQNKIQP